MEEVNKMNRKTFRDQKRIVPILVIIIFAIIIGVYYLVRSEPSPQSSTILQQIDTQAQTPLSSPQVATKTLDLSITMQSLKDRLQSQNIGVVFNSDIDKYYPEDKSQDVERGEVDTVTVYLIGQPGKNLTQISFTGDLYADGEKNNDTLRQMFQLTDTVDKDITSWFIEQSLEFESTSGTRHQKIINGKNVEVSYTYDKTPVFGIPGHIFVVITPALYELLPENE